jgi:hypothetical protein
MNLSVLPTRVIASLDRRVVGALQLIDAVTRTPLIPAGTVEVRRALMPGAAEDVLLPQGAVQIVQNRRGIHVLFRAPLFDTYINTFDNPQPPPETQTNPLRLRVNVVDGGGPYLPQTLQFALPRSLNTEAADSVFEPLRVEMLRAPSAPVQDGWATLRVRVTQTGVTPQNPLPGVLIRVFRSPRAPADRPIGMGMTDWRGLARGEALVPVTDILRFRPGSAQNVIETDQTIALELTRDTRFTGAPDQLPDVPLLVAGAGTGILRPPAAQIQIVRPAAPIRVQPGREYVVELTMP